MEKIIDFLFGCAILACLFVAHISLSMWMIPDFHISDAWRSPATPILLMTIMIFIIYDLRKEFKNENGLSYLGSSVFFNCFSQKDRYSKEKNMETLKVFVAIGHFVLSAGFLLAGILGLVWFICHGCVNIFRGKSFAD